MAGKRKVEELADGAAAVDPARMDLASVQTLAIEQGPAAIAALVKVMTEGTSEASRIAAANALLDRGYGKGRLGGELEPPPPPETIVTVQLV